MTMLRVICFVTMWSASHAARLGRIAPAAAMCPPRATPLTMRLPPAVLAAYERRFRPLNEPPPARRYGNDMPKRAVTEREVESLFKTLVRSFGGKQDLALRAVEANPTIVHPLYTDANCISVSKKALVEVMGSEEAAIEVMLLNPAILQCGESVRLQPADQVKSFASIRASLDKVPPSVSRALVYAVGGAVSLQFVLVRSDDPNVQQLSAAIKPLLGAAGASIFIAAVVLASVAEATASGAKMRREAK